MSASIFISFSSKDQRTAETICDALQGRGHACWISCRDIGPGENFQEAIVKAIGAAKLMVLVFSANANNSDEIKKEVALASQQRVVVVPVRIEDVVPTNAFAYELATRQWVDLFGDWDRNLERLSSKIQDLLSKAPPAGSAAAPPAKPTLKPPAKRQAALLFVLAGLSSIAAVGAGGSYFFLRGTAAGKFDGAWTTKMDCPKTATANPIAFEFVTVVKDSHLHGQYGEVGKPGTITLDGDVSANGSALVNAHGHSGQRESNQNNVPPGLPYAFDIPLQFGAAKAAASIHLPLGRPCDFTFVKK